MAATRCNALTSITFAAVATALLCTGLVATRPASAQPTPAAAGTTVVKDLPDPQDPYQSYPWLDMRKAFIGQAPVRFDARVRVQGPGFAEDPMNVPITVQVDPELGPVERFIVLVDRNPIRPVLEYHPIDALPAVSFRFKLEQASPVRAAVKLRNGAWVVGGTWVDSTGGGCTVSGATRKDGTWSKTLGEVSGRMFNRPAEAASSTAESAAGGASGKRDMVSRLRVQVMHPMDTGLVAGVPAFYVNRLSLRDAQDRELARLVTYEPVSENPVFSFDFPRALPGGVQIVGTDNNGNRIRSRVE